MKICVIGDPHGNLNKIKRIPLSNVDLILLTGDLGNANKARDIAFNQKSYSIEKEKQAFSETEKSALEIIKYLSNFAPIKIIYGNVELTPHIPGRKQTFAKEVDLTRKLIKNHNVSVINNTTINFKGIKIAGLEYFVEECWVRTFKPSNYSESLRDAKKQTQKAKKTLKWFEKFNPDILITHQPPYGILDKVKNKIAPKHWQGKNAGSKVILNFIKKKKPKYVFCGHIHEGKGKKKLGKTQVYNLGVADHKFIEFS